MKDYVIKYIQTVAENLKINISKFYDMINTKYLNEYGINFQLEEENQGLDMIGYAELKDKIDYSFLFRLLSMANKINNEYKGDK